jgi:hypothetical protein
MCNDAETHTGNVEEPAMYETTRHRTNVIRASGLVLALICLSGGCAQLPSPRAIEGEDPLSTTPTGGDDSSEAMSIPGDPMVAADTPARPPSSGDDFDADHEAGSVDGEPVEPPATSSIPDADAESEEGPEGDPDDSDGVADSDRPADDAEIPSDDDDSIEPDDWPEDDPDSGDYPSGVLTAGSFDDNLNYDVYSDFLSDSVQNVPAYVLPDIALGKRVIITVQNNAGQPIADARVIVEPTGGDEQQSQPVLDLTTGSDGRVLFLTGLDGGDESDSFVVAVYPPTGALPVEEAADLNSSDWRITLPSEPSVRPGQLDLAFVIDATGSMSDELEYIKTEVDGIVARVSNEFPEVDMRFALIVYRDDGDIYVTRGFDFTDSLETFQESLAAQRARGGGDYPEAMHLALEEAERLAWRERDTARVLFLIADAPPHEPFARQTMNAVGALRSSGVAIYPVAASGVALEAELIMRTAAMLTLSQYLFLTDDSGVGNPHAEPHIPCYHVEHLDRLMIRMIESELAGEAVYPEPHEVIRTVGNPVDGVCTGADQQGQPG